jgi:hypothetical protein
MKKYLFLLLATVSIYGQTYPTNPTAFGKISINTNVEDNTAAKITVQSSDNRINWLQPINIPVSIAPTNYAPTAPTLGGHILGIDNKLGHLTNTTAGVTTRVWFTADQTTITAGTFDLTNPLNKGTVASHQQTVANDDGQKKYFTTDLIGQPFAQATTFPIGLYAGNLSVSTTPTNANQKFTVELYKCNNAGTPIASGVAGAAVGDLGVTVIMILDSGEVTLANASVTNVGVSTILGSAFNIAVGERIRYHVSAEKAGTAGAVINESVYYGSSYNSFLDVPVIYNSTSIKDVSTVTNGAGTVTDALNTLNAAIPVNYTKTVYVDATSPNAATIFDDENPPVTNDDSLKANVNYLYFGSDASTWVYNVSTVNYVTKSIPATASVFYNAGTTVGATNTTAAIERGGNIYLTNPFAQIRGGTNADGFLFGNKTVTSYFQVAGSTKPSEAHNASIVSNGGIINFITNFSERMRISHIGKITVQDFVGTGTRQIVTDASGNLSATNVKITITTSTSITTATTDANSVGQDGHHVIIDNGVNVINLTCNGGVTTSYGKVGTGAITFVQGSGRTLVQLSGTAVFNGIAGSTATLWSNGTTDYLSINNY